MASSPSPAHLPPDDEDLAALACGRSACGSSASGSSSASKFSAGSPHPADPALAAEAFAALYRRYCDRVYRYHYARTGHVQDAQDLTTQTFLAALEGLPSYRRTGCFAAWLFGIARHKTALHFRSFRQEFPLDEALPDSAALPESAAAQRLLLEQLAAALGSLLPERAEAVLLCLVGDLTAAQAAQVMGKSTAAVKMLLFRGLKDLRAKQLLILKEAE